MIWSYEKDGRRETIKKFTWNPPSRMKTGRPKKTWLYGVVECMKEENIQENQR